MIGTAGFAERSALPCRIPPHAPASIFFREGIDFARKSRGPDRVLPGTGKPKSEFVGRESPPVALERKGLKIVLLAGHLGSLKLGSPVSYRGIGGIAFATPDDPKDGPAKDGTVFPLYDKPRKEWLGWAPKIPIPRESP